MTSSGNQALDLLILSPTAYPLDHKLPIGQTQDEMEERHLMKSMFSEKAVHIGSQFSESRDIMYILLILE